MNDAQPYNWLFRLAFKMMRYGTFVLLGFVAASFLSAALGAFGLVQIFVALIWQWFWRVALIIFCLVTTAAIAESVR